MMIVMIMIIIMIPNFGMFCKNGWPYPHVSINGNKYGSIDRSLSLIVAGRSLIVASSWFAIFSANSDLYNDNDNDINIDNYSSNDDNDNDNDNNFFWASLALYCNSIDCCFSSRLILSNFSLNASIPIISISIS